MQIRKPDLNIPKVIEEDKLEQISQAKEESTGFSREDLLEVVHPSIHGGPHFELGDYLRESTSGMEWSPRDTPAAEGIIATANEAFAPEDVAAKIEKIVENLKDRIQDSVQSAIHQFEDWFD